MTSQSAPLPSDTQTKPESTQAPAQTGPSQSLRFRRQAGLFFGGAAFALFSALITKRSVARRRAQLPNVPQPSTVLSKGVPSSGAAAGYEAAAAVTKEAASEATGAAGAASADADAAASKIKNSGAVLAIEALTLATLNVFSVAMMAVGGTLWYLDIASMDELRRKVRGGMGIDGTGRTEKDVEEEMEEWLATVLKRKEAKEQAREQDKAVGRPIKPMEPGEWRNDRGSPR